MLGRTSISSHESNSACIVVSCAWITGELGIGVAFWPEEDEVTLGEAVEEAWRLTVFNVERAGIQGRGLEPLIARKARVCPYIIARSNHEVL